VLIFERIREELRGGKSIRQSVETGYDRAFRTILDSNLTTMLIALILLSIGTGPVRGFAVVLTIGILTSMFPAVVVSRLQVEAVYGRRRITKLSI
jgi:preprotein translocase subunit SecD